MKVKLGAINSLYPLPVTIIGALVNGKPNYITIAHVGIADPGSVSLGMAKVHYTNAGIKENGTFSVNFPSVDMVKETDYCGLVSGRNSDKSRLFECFYGELKTAPMIRECALNMECRLLQTIDLPRHDFFIGEVIGTYVDKKCMTDDIVDFAKVNPILFAMNTRSYWKLGEQFARAWDIGKGYKPGQ